MERPPLPPRHLQLEVQREQEEPPEEHVTLIEDPAPKASSPPWRRLLGRMFPSPGERPGETLDESPVAEDDEVPAEPDPTETPGLEGHMIKLGSGREFHDVIEAEREENLFGGYQRLRRDRRTNARVGLIFAMLVGLALVLLRGVEYLSELISPRHAFELADVIGDEAARLVGFGAGLLAPLLALGLLQASIAALMGAVREKSVRASILATVAGVGCAVGMTRAAHGQYLSGLAVLVLAAILARLVRGVSA